MDINILIVDDNDDNLKTLDFLIDSIQFKNSVVVDVIKADSGKKALDIALKNEIALIILDIQMPQMNGFEVATYLQKTSKTKDIPIIFLTAAFKSQEMRDRGLHIGAVDYLFKPIDSVILIPKIKHYVDFFITTHELTEINKELEKKIAIAIEKNSMIEARLHQSEKLASMGEMIGNIAHQWRQPIAVISMWANNIIVDIDMNNIDTDSFKEYALKINEQTKYLSQTIDDFRNFFSPNKESTLFVLKDSIDKTLNLLSGSLKTYNIKTVVEIKNIKIFALENELTQVILNILKNAKDILVALPKDEKRLIFINGYEDSENTVIEIVDSGGGIADDIIGKIFEPYFTTKHKSQGTGIGLYMAQSIITRDFLGSLDVKNVDYSYENHNYNGAKFTIKIPIGEIKSA